ncbi:MAG: hypothetical protein LUO98_02890 [Methanoregula sp.]|nr:hypothetical protein [Methanoregula sp.]
MVIQVTDLLSHKTRRTDWHHVRHTYLVDVGTEIDIPLMEVSKLFENVLLDPPYPRTRYFEIEIDEKRDGTTRTALFQNIFPVRAERGPDWRFLTFRIRRGSWTVTERIHFPTDIGEAQWLYTDDFNILFLSAGGRHELGMLMTLITGKLGAIAQSFSTGNAIPSEFENQLSCRRAFDAMFREGVDRAFRDAAVYQGYGLIEPNKTLTDSAPPSAVEIGSHHGWSKVGAEMTAALHVDISEIEDLRDLGWLCT